MRVKVEMRLEISKYKVFSYPSIRCSIKKSAQTSILVEMVDHSLKVKYIVINILLCKGGRGAWSSDSCVEVSCTASDSNYTCCECHTYGHFGLLLVS